MRQQFDFENQKESGERKWEQENLKDESPRLYTFIDNCIR